MKNTKKRVVLTSLSLLSMSFVNVALADDAKNNGHEVDVKFRTIYFDRNYEKSKNDRSQSAYGAEFNYRTPKLADHFRVGLSAYAVQEIGSSGLVKTDVLPKVGDGLESYGLIGQAYVEMTPTKKSSIKLGRQKHKSLLLSTSGSRVVPSTFQGLSGKVKMAKGLSLYGAVFDKWSTHVSDDFQGFKTDTSAEGAIDYVSILGAKYKSGPYTVEGEYLNSKDYISKFGLRGSYVHKLAADSKLKFTGGIFTSTDNGDLFVTGSEGGELDDEDVVGSVVGVTKSSNDGQGILLEAAWKKKNTTVTAVLTKFDEPWLEDNYSGDTGRNPFSTRARFGPDVANANETAVALMLEHDWKGTINGLKSYLAVGKGMDAENSALGSAGGTADEDWVELKLTYKVPALKGLKVTGKYFDYSADETGSVDGVKGGQEHVRLYVDYTYKFR